MPHATFKKKFWSFLDVPDDKDYFDCSGSDESLAFGSLSPSSGTCPDSEDLRDAKSPVGDTNTFRRAIKRTLSWKRRKSHNIYTLHSDEKLTPEEESCTIFIIGYSGVGKTAAAVRFLTGRYIHEYQSAQEESYSRNVILDGANINVNLTSMARKTKKHEDKFTQPGTGIMLAYSVVDVLSFYYIESLLDEINAKKTPIMILGTKSDLDERRCVSKLKAEKLAYQKGCCYSECSAATNAGVVDCFRQMMSKSLKHGKNRWESSCAKRFDFPRIGARRRSSLS